VTREIAEFSVRYAWGTPRASLRRTRTRAWLPGVLLGSTDTFSSTFFILRVVGDLSFIPDFRIRLTALRRQPDWCFTNVGDQVILY